MSKCIIYPSILLNSSVIIPYLEIPQLTVLPMFE